MIARRRVVSVALAVSAVWLLAFVLDADAHVGRLGVAGAPVAIGSLLLLASITWPTRRWLLVVTVAATAVCAGGASLLAGGGDLSDAGGALAIAAALVVLAARLEADGGLAASALAAGGAVLVAHGLVGLEADTGGFARGGGAALAIGCALVVLGAGSRARRAGVLLLPLALLLGVQADTSLRAGVVFALVAVLVTDRPAASLGLWALAAATLSPPAAALLGAAAVLTGAWLHPIAPALALPGAAALAYAAAQHGSALRLVLALLAALTVARLWPGDDDGDLVERPSPVTLASVALGAWLVLAPETWGFAGAPGLGSWGTGVVWAGGAAAVGVFVVASFSEAVFVVPRLEVADPSYAAPDPRWAWRTSILTLAILGIAGARLVASVVS